MKTRSNLLILALVMCCMTSTLLAQPMGGPPPGMGGSGEGREKMRQRIEDIRKMKLIDVLNLQGEQVEKFFGTYNPLQKKVMESKDAVNSIARDLWRASEGAASEAELKSSTEKLDKALRDFEAAINARHEGAKKVLTTAQYARYLAFEALFVDQLTKMIIQQMRGGKNKGPRLDDPMD